MKTKVHESSLKQTRHGFWPPDGVYKGVWGGYKVTFFVEQDIAHYEVDAVEGIRTPKATCVVTVEGRNITVETTKD